MTFEIDMSSVDISYWRDHPNQMRSEGLWPGYHCNLDKELRRDFGITCGDYYKLYDKQKGKCFVCERKQKKRFDVHHDPFTGLLAALLCKICNRNISYKVIECVKNPPGEEFQIYVNSKRVKMRDKRLREKRELTAARRADEKPPEPIAVDPSASAEEKMRRALASST